MPSYPPQGPHDPFHDRHSPSNPGLADSQSSINRSQSPYRAPHQQQQQSQPTYQLADQYSQSMQSLPNASQYSLSGGTVHGHGDPGEKYFGDDGYSRAHDDSDKTPLRADFGTQPHLGYDPDTPL